jgi:hypothetical protein
VRTPTGQTTASRIDFARLDLIDVAPYPRFTGLDRTHQRVMLPVEMLGRVLVLRRIAASYVSAGEAHAKVYPRIAGFHTVFTDVFACFLDLDLVQVRAFICHRFSEHLAPRSSDPSHVTKGNSHIKSAAFSPKIIVEVLSSVLRLEYLRLDYLSCVLTVASTILVGRRCWEGWALAGVNSVIICVIGFRTEQLGFIPANLFCMVISAMNLRAWRKP